LHCLNDAHDHFEAIFLRRVPFWLRYDYYLVIEREQLLTARVDKRRVVRVLEQGYMDRVRFVRPHYPPHERVWSLLTLSIPTSASTSTSTSTSPATASATNTTSDDLVVGLRVDAAHYWRLVDRGPAAEQSKQAQQWRDFWGTKAQVRRFRDGSILQCAGTLSPKTRTH
jgi:U3 small nucleolar RNA-associated protein 22